MGILTKQIRERAQLGSVISAVLLTFVLAGNVIKARAYRTTSSGAYRRPDH